MTREELLKSPGYWIGDTQIILYNLLHNYMLENNLEISDVAQKLELSEQRVREIMQGDSDLKLSELICASITMGYIPKIKFVPIEEVIEEDKQKHGKK